MRVGSSHEQWSTEGMPKKTEARQEYKNERYHDACEGRMRDVGRNGS